MSERKLMFWRSVDSFASQLGQAGASLVLTLTFSHLLEASDFGVLAAFWAIYMLFMSLNRAVFGEQLIAQSDDIEMRHGYLDFGFLCSSIGLVLAVGIACMLGNFDIILALISVGLFVASDVVRYGEMAGGRGAVTRRFVLLPIEFIRLAFGLLALLLALSGEAPLWSVGFACLSSATWVVFGLAVEGLPRMSRAIQFLRRKQKFERLMTAQFLVGTGLSQAVPFLALSAFGSASYGSIRLAQSVLSPMALVTSAFQPSLIRLYANRKKSGGLARAVVVTVGLSLVVGVAMTLVALSAVAFLGRFVIPAEQIDAVHRILMPTAVLLSLVVVGQPGGAIIKVFRFGGISFLGQTIGITVTVVLSLLAIHQSIEVFVWGMAVGSATTVTSTYLLLVFGLRHAYGRRVADSDAA